jgi:hypothetical protein
MIDRDLVCLQDGNGLVELSGFDVEGEVVSAGELLGGIGMGRGQIRFAEEVENGAIGQAKVGDFTGGDEFCEGGGDFGAGEFVETEDVAVELARSIHVLDIEGDVMDGAEDAGWEAGRSGHGVSWPYSVRVGVGFDRFHGFRLRGLFSILHLR